MNPVSVNDVVIAERVIAAEMQNQPAASPEAAWTEAARALAIRELLLQEARRQGMNPSRQPETDGSRLTEEETLIDRLLDAEITMPDADEDACRRYYGNNRQRFRSPDLFEAAHILLPASPDDRMAYDAAVQQAEGLIATLQVRPGDFTVLAQRHSACPSAAQGGRLGQVARGQTVPEFETFLCGLDAGQLCPVPVKTRYGAHVLRLDHRIEGRELPFELVWERVASYLRETCWRQAVAQYIDLLAGQADMQGIDLGGSRGRLVQ
ncbi:MAG: peptidylprolyl isomerase [Alphaproteobacteria bacterium]|nr:peptidylprolyl isomerase [Alphaproteobacteria bacterium]